jgi:UDP-N-acetylglucosamine--N-acetylmuramyl-(pentapeptide) pyrophosphoryl-undecaprenol N-acetylglucosamine transferase
MTVIIAYRVSRRGDAAQRIERERGTEGVILGRIEEALRRRISKPPAWLWAARYGPERMLGRARMTLTRPDSYAELTEDVTVPMPPRSDQPLSPTVLFHAIDGAGLGHLARCLAIARHLDGANPFFITTCRRADVLDAYGIGYRSFPSFEDSGSASARAAWQRKLQAEIKGLLRERRPSIVVTDGVAADVGLVRALRDAPEVARVGIRRAYRLDGREHLVVERDRSSHLLLIPHDRRTEPVRVPAGPGVAWVGPLIVSNRDEALSRDDARRALGLPADGTCVLVQLGAGRIGRGKEMQTHAVRLLTSRGVHAAVTSYEARSAAAGDRVTVVDRFPLAQASRAFDAAIAAPGYNTFHELMHHGVPTIFVPNAATISDDQTARARRAELAGAALLVSEGDVSGLAGAVDRLLGDGELRERFALEAGALVPRNGAREAARLIDRLTELVLER